VVDERVAGEEDAALAMQQCAVTFGVTGCVDCREATGQRVAAAERLGAFDLRRLSAPVPDGVAEDLADLRPAEVGEELRDARVTALRTRPTEAGIVGLVDEDAGPALLQRAGQARVVPVGVREATASMRSVLRPHFAKS
jgi:hypothetical protein